MTATEQKELNRRCQEAIEPIVRAAGCHARIVFYPGPDDKEYGGHKTPVTSAKCGEKS